ncbi:MAG: type IV secretory system conjugative DNA transfer family protein [Solirubrobacterales bacterium]|nr:type IV secretory system conjugative DNA transfer family protein [Solirubrobacterales bacterium]
MSNSRQPGFSDAAAVVAIATALAIAALLWLWGGIAGALFGRGWPHLGAGQMASVLMRLPGHLGDPARAWPAPIRSRMPGPPGFYAALAMLCSLAGTLAYVLTRATTLVSARRRASGARWAKPGDLRSLRGGGDGGRLALGRHRGHLLRAEQRHALVAFGPPQSGKSAGLAVPALLEWQGPAVASSIKTDLLAASVRRRRSLGEVFVFDPFGLAGTASNTWSPLRGAGTWDGALEVAWRLASAGELDQRSVEGGDFWAIAAEQRLAPLLYAAAATGATIESVVRWAYGQGARELDQNLAQLAGDARDDAELADAHAAYDAVRAFETQADRTRSSIEATAQALLRAYRFSRVARSARSCEITPDRLLDQAATLYLIGDAKASKLLRPIFLALVSEIIDRAYERATLAGGRLELPLLLCLDEAGNIAPLPNLAEIASTAPSHNIQLISIFHDLAQARSRYRQQAETVVNSHRARMLLPGVADLETLRYFAGLVGDEETRDRSVTTGAGGTTRSTAVRRRPLVAAEALRQLPHGHGLLLYGRIPPLELRLRMWFADRRLRRLAGG